MVVLYLGLFISIKLQKSKYSSVILKIEFTSTKKCSFIESKTKMKNADSFPKGGTETELQGLNNFHRK